LPSQHTTEGIIVPLELAEFRIVSQTCLNDGTLRVEVIATSTQAPCPQCQQPCVKIHDTRARKKRDVALREHVVELIVLKRHFRCLHCRRAFTEADSACGWRRRTTARWRYALGRLASQQPIEQVAQAAGVGSRFVRVCWQALATAAIEHKGLPVDEHEPLPSPRWLGIDEFARRKGHVYETILCDLEAHRVLEVSAGRKQAEVMALLERLGAPDAVQAVSMDMSGTFRSAVQMCLPKAQIVVDHFHVVQHVMKAFRKIVSSWAHKKEGKALLQGKQHLFLRAQEALSQEQAQERSTVGVALPLLKAAWQLKEALRTWYATATLATAAAGLDAWIEQVQQSGCEPLRKALSAFVQWREEMLAFFQFLPTCISNGFVEGKTNRTKAIMRQAYGYRNRHHLRLRILAGELA
jgi:transposase